MNMRQDKTDKRKSLSVVLATRNEEENIGRVIDSIKDIADEIIIFDEESGDRTKEIAESKGARVVTVKHEAIFHITKQKALDEAKSEWILQLDADEVVTPSLSKEIRRVIKLSDSEILGRKLKNHAKLKLFLRHEKAYETMYGKIGKQTGEVVAFLLPRVNLFVGKPLVHAGVYPDPAIRLIKRGKARFPSKSVHENMEIDGEVAWLFNDLEHHDSPTIGRYIARMNRYTDLSALELAAKKVSKNYWNLFFYTVIKPKLVFLNLYLRHGGYKDGIRGFLWSAFSSMHYPMAYYKYRTNRYT